MEVNMKVFATNWLETATDDYNGGNEWTWNPIYDSPNKQTGPGKPTNTQVFTAHDDQNTDHDQPQENLGMLVA